MAKTERTDMFPVARSRNQEKGRFLCTFRSSNVPRLSGLTTA